MREIKFRAWDVKNKVMINHGAFQFEQYPSLVLRPEQLKPLVFPFDGIESGEMITEPPLDAWNTMQYTGLKDLNEKEIYEGDVDFFGWIVCFERGVFCLKQSLSAKTFIPICEAEVNTIIGNIYENPELLKPE